MMSMAWRGSTVSQESKSCRAHGPIVHVVQC